MESGEHNFVDDAKSKNAWENQKESWLVAISCLYSSINECTDENGIAEVAENPEEEEANSELHVVVLERCSFLGILGDLVCSSGSWNNSWSITPRNIMQVAHSVDLENARKCWHEQDVGDQTENIGAEVLNEVDWSCSEWDHVHHQHNDSTTGENVDFSSSNLVFVVQNSDPSITFLFLASCVPADIISIGGNESSIHEETRGSEKEENCHDS